MDVIFLDFAKAFDKVPHKRLILKLRAHGIIGKVALWIVGLGLCYKWSSTRVSVGTVAFSYLY